MEVVFLMIGLAAGYVIAWLYASLRSKSQESTPGIALDELETKYVQRDFYDREKEANKDKELEIRSLNMQLAKAEQLGEDLIKKLEEQKQEVAELQANFRVEMKNLSNEILEEKSKKFLELNEKRVGEILNPLKEKLHRFEEKVEKSNKESLEWNVALREQVKGLVDANKRMSEDANRLTDALKGDKKMQGNWGEMQLELILEKAGLEKGIHYRKEASLQTEGGQRMRPDYIINLPDEKNLIIDSKVSLVAYEGFFNAEDESSREQHLKAHLLAINNHIVQLGNKNYQKLHDINPPDYVLMFVPIEPALNLALKEDQGLFEKALGKNIVMVSTSTLLATLRTISYIWKQENQRKNVVEIARESGALYDKFVAFMEDMQRVGDRLNGAKEEHAAAMNKLFESKKKGDTIVGRIERIKKLGADASKQLPRNLLDRSEE